MSEYKVSKINVAKISHDIDQLLYLKKIGAGSDEDNLLIENLQTLKSLIEQSGKRVIQVTELIENLVGADYLLSKSFKSPSALSTSAVRASSFASPQIISFSDNKYKIYVFDGVLAEEALVEVQKFCREARIWFEIKEKLKYLYTDSRYGFQFDLLTQVQNEIQKSLLPYIGTKNLFESWAIKYELQESGIPAHADQIAGCFTANLWITPTVSNLDSQSGGMSVLNLHAPESWAWPIPITDEEKIAEYIHQKNPEEINVSYRENRLILFNSELFHKTQAVRFGPAYEDRRVSLTHIYK